MNPNEAVITSKQIITDRMPILFVSHDEDGFWQFLSGHEETEQDGRIIGLKEAIDIDPSIKGILWITEGFQANRNNINEEWSVFIKIDKL